tara:strand:- start:56 stop:217 length:162 start_codon:yes stop_codon:yes gene_type:complete
MKNNLTHKQFEAIRKHVIKKKSIKQIAKEEKISESAVYKRLQTIKKKGINLNF